MFFFGFEGRSYGALCIRDPNFIDGGSSYSCQLMGVIDGGATIPDAHYTITGDVAIDGTKLLITHMSYIRHNASSTHAARVDLILGTVFGIL